MYTIKNLIKFCITATFTLNLSAVSHAETIKASSKITAVTVYPDSALVTRSAVVDLKAGPSTLSLDGIVPAIDENSLSVSGEGTSDAKIFGAEVSKEFLQESADQRVQDLTAKIENLQDQITQQSTQSAILDKQKEFLDSVKLYAGQQIPKDLVTKMPSPAELEGTLNFLGSQLNGLETKKEDIRLKTRDLQKEKEKLERELEEVRGGAEQKQSHSILVDVDAGKSGKLTVNVTYLVYGVRWYPMYDARVSMDKKTVDLTGFGVISQNSGEDWNDVAMTISTAKPSMGGRLPYVSPWFLRQQPPMVAYGGMAKARKEAFVAGMVDQMQALSNTEAMSPELKGENIAAEAPAPPATIAYTQAQSKGVAVIYKLPKKANVKSDGSEQKVPMFNQTLKSDFKYSTYPRLSPYVYLGSRVSNDKDLQLLAGKVNVFLDGDFVGTSGIDNVGPAEEFDLYLGVDENVKVKRQELEHKVDDVLIVGISSPNIKTTIKYKLSVENYKTQKIDVILFEATPVSQNERIKAKIHDVSLQPSEKDWKNRAGIWQWTFSLEPKAKQEIFYTTTIEYPRDMQVEGL